MDIMDIFPETDVLAIPMLDTPTMKHETETDFTYHQPVQDNEQNQRILELRTTLQNKGSHLSQTWLELNEILGRYQSELFNKEGKLFSSGAMKNESSEVERLKNDLNDSNVEKSRLESQVQDLESQIQLLQMDHSVKEGLCDKYQQNLLEKEAALMNLQAVNRRLEGRISLMESKLSSKIQSPGLVGPQTPVNTSAPLSVTTSISACESPTTTMLQMTQTSRMSLEDRGLPVLKRRSPIASTLKRRVPPPLSSPAFRPRMKRPLRLRPQPRAKAEFMNDATSQYIERWTEGIRPDSPAIYLAHPPPSSTPHPPVSTCQTPITCQTSTSLERTPSSSSICQTPSTTLSYQLATSDYQTSTLDQPSTTYQLSTSHPLTLTISSSSVQGGSVPLKVQTCSQGSTDSMKAQSFSQFNLETQKVQTYDQLGSDAVKLQTFDQGVSVSLQTSGQGSLETQKVPTYSQVNSDSTKLSPYNQGGSDPLKVRTYGREGSNFGKVQSRGPVTSGTMKVQNTGQGSSDSQKVNDKVGSGSQKAQTYGREQRPCQCHICGCPFFSGGALAYHVRQHDTSTFRCQFCDQDFISQNLLTEHLNALCPICHGKFACKKKLMGHSSAAHKKNKETLKGVRVVKKPN